MDAIYVGPSGPIQPALPAIAKAANQLKIPVINFNHQAVRDHLVFGSIGVDYLSVGRNTGRLIVQKLRNQKHPIQVYYPSKNQHFGLINEKIAKQLKISIPQSINKVGVCISLKNVKKSFDRKVLFDQLNLNINQNDFCVVLGNNGSGKSTLFRLISKEVDADDGVIQLRGQHAKVMQDYQKGTVTQLSVLENLAISLSHSIHLRFYRRFKKLMIDKLSEFELGLEKMIDEPMSHLSGGQRQMIAMLMALNLNRPILLLDEHTSALDPHSRKVLMNYTKKKFKEHRLTILMITHHIEDALNYGNRLLVLKNGKLIKDLKNNDKKNLTKHDLLEFFHEPREFFMNIELMYQGFEQGLILALVSFGMMIPFRYLDFPDLSVEGAFPLGGAIYAVAVLSGFSPISSIVLAMMGAAILALCVSMVTCYLKVNSLLAGIILAPWLIV